MLAINLLSKFIGMTILFHKYMNVALQSANQRWRVGQDAGAAASCQPIKSVAVRSGFPAGICLPEPACTDLREMHRSVGRSPENGLIQLPRNHEGIYFMCNE